MIDLAEVYISKEEYTKALVELESALALNRKLEHKNNVVSNYLMLSKVYFKLRDLDRALQYTEEALKLVSAKGSLKEKYELNDQMYQIFKEKRQPSVALTFLEKSMVFKDSIYNRELLTTTSELETRYQNQKKEATNKLLTGESQNLKKRQVLLIITILLFLVLTIVLIILYRIQQGSARRQSVNTINVARFRLRKKLNMDTDEKLFNFLVSV